MTKHDNLLKKVLSGRSDANEDESPVSGDGYAIPLSYRFGLPYFFCSDYNLFPLRHNNAILESYLGYRKV
jgi:hypothetical protein